MMLDKLVLALVIIGALNWGSIGIFQFDLVAALFGGPATDCSAAGIFLHVWERDLFLLAFAQQIL